MKVLIVGCGDLGLRVAKILLETPSNEVWAMRRHPPAEPRIPGLQWIAADLANPATLTRLPVGITHLVYLAAPDNRTEQAYRAVYRQGTENVLNALGAPGPGRMIFVSSSAVYGNHGDDWVDEMTPAEPPGFNGRILLETEDWLARRPGRYEGA